MQPIFKVKNALPLYVDRGVSKIFSGSEVFYRSERDYDFSYADFQGVSAQALSIEMYSGEGCGSFNGETLDEVLEPMSRVIDTRFLSFQDDRFCKNHDMQYVYENSSGAAWSCGSGTDFTCASRDFSFDASSIVLNRIS